MLNTRSISPRSFASSKNSGARHATGWRVGASRFPSRTVIFGIVRRAIFDPRSRSGASGVRINRLVGERVERFLEAVGVRTLRLGERLEPVGDLGEAFLACGLRHAGIHVGVFVGLSGDGGLQIQARPTERKVRRRIAALLQVFEMAVGVAGFALGGGAEDRCAVGLPLDVGPRRTIKIAPVWLRVPGERGPFDYHRLSGRLVHWYQPAFVRSRPSLMTIA